MSCNSMAVVLTLVQTKNKTKYTYKKQYKDTIQTKQSTINTTTHIIKIPTH